jgi:Bax protein
MLTLPWRFRGWKAIKMSRLAVFARQNRILWVFIVLAAYAAVLWALLVPQGGITRVAAERLNDSVATTAPSALRKPGTVMLLPSIDKLDAMFAGIGYHLDDVRNGSTRVPRLTLAGLPPDMAQISLPGQRKEMFLRYMLPLILEANHRVLEQRNRLLALKRDLENGASVSLESWRWFLDLADEYQVGAEQIVELVRRVDITPPSLALAQAAIESGWGTSRFALEGNSAFGQWTTEQYDGLVPHERPEGHSYKIRSFERPIDAVHSYIRNLNTHRAYRAFRKKRAALRDSDGTLDSMKLVETLEGYAEEGEIYLRLLKRVILINNLRTLDSAKLGDDVLSFGPDA